MATPVVRISEFATQIGITFTALTGVAYAAGYLARAARARALGTEPDLVLISQAYVFGGFRFALFTLLAFLIALPLVVLLWVIARWITSSVRPVVKAWLQLATVVFFGAVTLILYGSTLRVTDALLRPRSDVLSPGLCEAVLGRNEVGLALVIGGAVLAASSFLLLRARYLEKGVDTLSLALGVIVAVHLLLMPIQYGVFYADRTARELERAPEGLAGIEAPLWLIDRGNERVSILARGIGDRLKLVSVKSDSLDGIGVTRSVDIGDVVGTGGNSPCAPLPPSSG